MINVQNYFKKSGVYSPLVGNKISAKSDVFLMDCMDGMKQFPDKYFDLAVVDPPYFSGPEKRKFYGNATGTSKHSKTGDYHTVKRVEYSTSDWSDQIPDYDYLKELVRVSNNQIIWGINYFDFAGYHPGRIVWDKVNLKSSFSDCEIALCTYHESTRYFQYMWNGMMQGKSLGSLILLFG